jgi:hypothetical protein
LCQARWMIGILCCMMRGHWLTIETMLKRRLNAQKIG